MVGLTLSSPVPSPGILDWLFGPSNSSNSTINSSWNPEQLVNWISTNSTGNSSWNPEQLVDWVNPEQIKELLPTKLYDFFDESLGEGKDVVYDLFDNLEEEVISKTSNSLDGLGVWFSDLEGNLQNVRQSVVSIFGREKPLSVEEVSQSTQELKTLKSKFDNFEEKVKEEIETEKNLPFALRNQLIQFITAGREMLASIGREDETYFGMLRQLENEAYKIKLVLAESSEELKEKMDSLFVSLQQVDLTKFLEDDEESSTPKKTE